VANIREYEETHLQESQRLAKEKRELGAQVGWGCGGSGRLGWGWKAVEMG
jgi:hypothetical protein